MGYSTSFSGEFHIVPVLTSAQIAYLKALSSTRRMARDPEKLKDFPDPLREAVGLPLGPEGMYFVGDSENYGQNKYLSILDFNNYPGYRITHQPEWAQPGLWLQWVPSDDGTILEWDQGEKFNNYVEWLQWLQNYVFNLWNVTLEGEVRWQGEESDDIGVIYAKPGYKIESCRAIIQYPKPSWET